MAEIFVNYRTGDQPDAAVLLKRELSRVFGENSVFLATTMIRAGEDFERELLRRVRGAEVLLAVVGPRWLTAASPSGARALDEASDWVRREIAEAFAAGVRVIPVLIDDTERLTDAPLPEDLSDMAKCQHVRIRHEDFDQDLARLVDELTEAVPSLRTTRPEPDAAPGSVIMTGTAHGNGRVYQAGRDQHIHE